MAAETNGRKQTNYSPSQALGGPEARRELLEAKVNNLEEKVNSVDGQFTTLEERVAQIEERLAEFEERVTKVEQRLEVMRGLGIAILLALIANLLLSPIFSGLF